MLGDKTFKLITILSLNNDKDSKSERSSSILKSASTNMLLFVNLYAENIIIVSCVGLCNQMYGFPYIIYKDDSGTVLPLKTCEKFIFMS